MTSEWFLRRRSVLRAALAAVLVAGTSAGPAAAYIRIDDFRDPQTVLLPDGETFAYGTAIAPKVLGGERDVSLVRQSDSVGDITLRVATGGNQLLSLDNAADAYVELTLVYDGVDGDPGGIDLSGLGDLDLTELGTEDRFAIRLRTDEAALAFVQIFDTGDPTGNTWSAGSVFVQASDSFAWYELPFAELTLEGPSGPANLRDVGAILLRLSGDMGLDVELADFRVPEPGAGAAGLAALLTLAVARRTRR